MVEAKNSKVKNKFKMEVIKSEILDGQQNWQRVAEMIRSIARMELGKISGKVCTAGQRKTWWWNQGVQEKLLSKRKANNLWDTIRNDTSKLVYETARK